MEASSGRDDVPLPVLLLVCLLDGLVILGVFLQVFVKEEVSVDDTEIVDH